MITLAATNTLQAKAGTGAVITYTIFGDSVASGIDTFQVLAQGQLTTSAVALITVATSTVNLIKDIHLANTSGSLVSNVILYINGSAAANQIVSLNIPANGEAVYSNNGWIVYDSNGSMTTGVADGSLTNTKLATMANLTVKGNTSGGVAAPSDLATTGVASSVVLANASVQKPKEIEGGVYVDTANTQGWAGSDGGAWINSAFAYLITTYGTSFSGPPVGFTGAGIIQLAPGTYTFTTPIVLADQWFSIKLRGSGEGMALTPAGASGKGGTVLNYTPTSGIALTIAGASSNNGGVHIEDLVLFGGTVGTIAAVPGGSAIGIQWGVTGGTPPPGSSTAGGSARNVAVANFNIGENWNATGSIAYAVQHYNCKVQFCGTGYKPYGEANCWYGGLIGQNTTGVDASNSGTDASFFGVAFDDNTTTGINVSNSSFRCTFSGCRFENAGLGTSVYITISNGSVAMYGGSLQEDNTTGTATGFVQSTGGVVYSDGVWHYSGGRSITQAYNVSSTGTVNLSAPIIAPGGAAGAIVTWVTAGVTAVQGRVFNIIGGSSALNNPISPTTNTTATVIPLTTITNVDSRGGITIPASVKIGTKIRITVDASNIATIQTLSATLRFGIANSNADGVVLSQVFAAGTAVVGSGKFVYEFIVLSSTTAQATLQFFNGNGAATGIAGNVSLFQGLSAPGTIATAAQSFLGVYFSSTVASVITVRSVTYEVVLN